MFVKWFVLFSWVALVLKLPSERRRWIYHPEHHLLVSTNRWACPGLVLLQMISVIIVHWCLCEPCHQHHQYNIRSLALFWFHVWWLVLSPKWFFLTLIIYYLFNWNKYFFLKPRRFKRSGNSTGKWTSYWLAHLTLFPLIWFVKGCCQYQHFPPMPETNEV